MRYWRGTTLERFQEHYDPSSGLYSLDGCDDSGRVYLFKEYPRISLDALLGLWNKEGAAFYALLESRSANETPLVFSGELTKEQQERLRQGLFGWYLHDPAEVTVDSAYDVADGIYAKLVMLGIIFPLTLLFYPRYILPDRYFSERSLEAIMEKSK
ncbi:MAG: hypothetical protein GXP63_02035 [DPANN group archaeon]|nr:hypothetical protein [DPANN group archaeon]